MPGAPPNPIRIYYIMHGQNLTGVIAAGQLLCKNQRILDDPQFRSIAHENIQRRRHDTLVPCGPRGTVHDYVPWYFAPRSPMLYANFKGSVSTNLEGQQAIIYLTSTVDAVVAANLPFVFTDGHAIMFNSNFYDTLAHLREIDWPLMDARYWHAINTDLDRPRRRQAEFLVHHSFPWQLVDEIGVYDEGKLEEVRTSLQGIAHQPTVRLRRAWYF